MTLLGVDIGTTHCKAGLFTPDGAILALASRPTVTRRTAEGHFFYDPEELWATVAACIAEVAGQAATIAAIGIASMAETGLLIDRRSGLPRSSAIPWFDRRATQQAQQLAPQAGERLRLSGLQLSFKYGLAKLLWLRQHQPEALPGSVWLSAADYIAYRLTGQLATDYTLAARTYAFRITDRRWDEGWVRELGLDPALFPPALPSGQPAGQLHSQQASALGLPSGCPVAIAGHDHLVAALAVGVVEPGRVLDSIGTAESLLGVLEPRPLGEQEQIAGLSYGLHVVPERYVWVGGMSASGGSLEWLSAQLGDEPLSYAQLSALQAQAGHGPTGILYYPYLSGSAAPEPDQNARAALIGLSAAHRRADLVKAVLEGTAYEAESIRRAAERLVGQPIARLLAVGGGTRNRAWMQIKANVSGCQLDLLDAPEATLLGAALLAGVGAGLYSGIQQAVGAVAARHAVTSILPDQEQHQAYRRWYEQGYLRLQHTLRQHYNQMRE